MQVGAINIIGEDVVGKMVRQLPDEPQRDDPKDKFIWILKCFQQMVYKD